MSARRSIGALLIAALIIACAGCGSSRLSQTALRIRADAICTKLTRATQPIASPSKRNLDAGFTSIRAALTRLAALRPPQQDEAAYHDMLMRLRASTDSLQASEPLLLRHFRAIKRLEASMRNGINRLPHSKQAARASRRLIQFALQENAVLRPVRRDTRLAAGDARALHLSSCASGISGD